MTGFGESTKQIQEVSCQTQIRGYNSKSLDIKLKLPSRINTFDFEDKIKKLITSRISRGRVDLSLSFDQLDKDKQQISDEVLKEFSNYVDDIERKINRKIELKLSDINHFNANFQIEEDPTDHELLQNLAYESIDAALNDFSEYRKTEGEKTSKIITNYIIESEDCISQIEEHIEESKTQAIEKLKSNLQLIMPLEQAEPSLLREIGILIDKLDISEETERLKLHTKKSLGLINENLPNGKRLEFLCQEMMREANTICSKSNNSSVKEYAMQIKTNNEKIREQIMNVE